MRHSEIGGVVVLQVVAAAQGLGSGAQCTTWRHFVGGIFPKSIKTLPSSRRLPLGA